MDIKGLAIKGLKSDMQFEISAAMGRWGIDSEMLNREAFSGLVEGLEPLTDWERKAINEARTDIEVIERKYGALISKVALS